MAQAYFQSGNVAPASFSLSIRHYPKMRTHLIAAGLADTLETLQTWRFPHHSIDYLHSTRLFDQNFLEFLAQLTFTGDVWALPEGTILFGDEPILEVTAPIIQAALVQTIIHNQVFSQSIIATNAVRYVEAARGKIVSDFSMQSTHGTDRGIKSTRSSYIAGFQSSSNVLAGKVYGIPLIGTMSHSFVSVFSNEEDSFRAFCASFPKDSTFLIDAYDVIMGTYQAITVAHEMETRGERLKAVQLSKGDLATISQQVRAQLDKAGLDYVKIMAGGDLDEYDVDRLCQTGAPIDIFGVDTKARISAGDPYFKISYKMVRYDDAPVIERCQDMVSLPSEKQVYRQTDSQGMYIRDIIALRGELALEGEPLLQKVMSQGRAITPFPSLERIRQQVESGLSRLDAKYRTIHDTVGYPVTLSPAMDSLFRAMEQNTLNNNLTREGEL
jgi:nicotinate phosphoribosyltransferase